MSTTTDVAALCSALADERRWEILHRLGRAPASASELADELPISRQAIARHLAILAGSGLIEPERAGRQLRYRALGDRLSGLAHDLEAIGQSWDRRLAAIKEIAEGP